MFTFELAPGRTLWTRSETNAAEAHPIGEQDQQVAGGGSFGRRERPEGGRRFGKTAFPLQIDPGGFSPLEVVAVQVEDRSRLVKRMARPGVREVEALRIRRPAQRLRDQAGAGQDSLPVSAGEIDQKGLRRNFGIELEVEVDGHDEHGLFAVGRDRLLLDPARTFRQAFHLAAGDLQSEEPHRRHLGAFCHHFGSIPEFLAVPLAGAFAFGPAQKQGVRVEELETFNTAVETGEGPGFPAGAQRQQPNLGSTRVFRAGDRAWCQESQILTVGGDAKGQDVVFAAGELHHLGAAILQGAGPKVGDPFVVLADLLQALDIPHRQTGVRAECHLADRFALEQVFDGPGLDGGSRQREQAEQDG